VASPASFGIDRLRLGDLAATTSPLDVLLRPYMRPVSPVKLSVFTNGRWVTGHGEEMWIVNSGLIGSVSYQVQGRCAGRDGEERENVRLVSTSDRAAAFAAASAMVGEGFTAWVFETGRVGARRSYRLLDTLRPVTGRR
jgi:hypothetical protein